MVVAEAVMVLIKDLGTTAVLAQAAIRATVQILGNHQAAQQHQQEVVQELRLVGIRQLMVYQLVVV